VTRPALCVLLVILAGCGGAERVATATRTPDRATGDRAAIQARVAAYLRHMLAGEGEQACAQLTPGYRRDLDTRAADAGLGDCATVLSGYGEIASAGETKAFLRDAAKPGRVIVLLQGDRAQASVVTPDRKLSTKRTALRRVGTRWLIDELGVSRTR
jgi:hypothetical protein